MRGSNCECGREKRDHRRTAYRLAGDSGYGECKVCLCKTYTRVSTPGTQKLGTDPVLSQVRELE
jgi:hypothetical protein